jgi:hypothetical protein
MLISAPPTTRIGGALPSDRLQVTLLILNALNTDCVARVVVSGVLHNAEGALLPGDI